MSEKQVTDFRIHREQGGERAAKENMLACNMELRASKPEWLRWLCGDGEKALASELAG